MYQTKTDKTFGKPLAFHLHWDLPTERVKEIRVYGCEIGTPKEGWLWDQPAGPILKENFKKAGAIKYCGNIIKDLIRKSELPKQHGKVILIGCKNESRDLLYYGTKKTGFYANVMKDMEEFQHIGCALSPSAHDSDDNKAYVYEVFRVV